MKTLFLIKQNYKLLYTLQNKIGCIKKINVNILNSIDLNLK